MPKRWNQFGLQSKEVLHLVNCAVSWIKTG